MAIHLTKHLKHLKLTSIDIEVALAHHFDFRRNLIVPNVYWGLNFGHEIDLLVVYKSGWAYEIEIKVSKADIKRDQKKGKWNGRTYGTDKIKCMFFAVPESLKDFALEHIPAECGLITVAENELFDVNTCKSTTINKNARKLTDSEILKLAKLGCMRIWSLKNTINDKREGRS